MQMTFSVIPSPAGVLTEVPESKTIRVILVGVKGASSFMNAVARAMQQIDLDDRVGALWTLHDDSSRPMSHALRCCSMLGKTRRLRLCLARNSWIGRRKACITSVCMRGTTMSRLWWWTVSRIRNSMMAGRMCWLCSLSGALVPLATLRTWKGVDPWFGTFAESTDLCRRICLGGGRVVVVPQARIAHRRARFEGVRSKNGQPVEDEEGRVDPYLAVREANTKYAYTDVHRSWWPLLWIWSILKRWDWPCCA